MLTLFRTFAYKRIARLLISAILFMGLLISTLATIDRRVAAESNGLDSNSNFAFNQLGGAAQSTSELDFTPQFFRNDNQGAAQDAAWGDMDGDGDLDLAIANAETTFIYINQGSHNFDILELDGISESVAWGDVDGDGDLDLLTNAGEISTDQQYM